MGRCVKVSITDSAARLRQQRRQRRALAGTPTLVGILVEEHLGIIFHQLYTNFKDISKENDEAVPT